MMGYGPEDTNPVMEFTYNYGVTEYDKGNAYAQVGAVPPPPNSPNKKKKRKKSPPLTSWFHFEHTDCHILRQLLCLMALISQDKKKNKPKI